MDFQIGIGPNVRKSVYFDATVAAGVAAFSVYNHMLIPAHFGDPEAEYESLMTGVAQWDVAAQRQVEISGPDAGRVIQYLTTRDMRTTRIGQGRYVPLCDHDGLLINDPVLLRVGPERYWLSIADSDIALWASAIAAERGMDVRVAEPDVSPLAIQGPLAEAVAVKLFGDWPKSLPYFGFREADLHGIPLILARSGWSKQGGFEIYLQDGARAPELWDRVTSAGAEFGIRPGAPNDRERIESGLVSYGADGRVQVNPCNPFEIGLGKLVDFDKPDDFVGKAALQRIKAEGPKRRRVGFAISGPALGGCEHAVAVRDKDGEVAGVVSEYIYSPRMAGNIGVGMVSTGIPDDAPGLTLTVEGQARAVEIRALPFA